MGELALRHGHGPLDATARAPPLHGTQDAMGELMLRHGRGQQDAMAHGRAFPPPWPRATDAMGELALEANGGQGATVEHLLGGGAQVRSWTAGNMPDLGRKDEQIREGSRCSLRWRRR